ncbi:MAG: hypothetical protein ACRYFS_24525 [Janthinobacterium lividum]
MTFAVGQRVEVWFAGWDQWAGGTVTSTGFLDSTACLHVLLDGGREPCVCRVDQCRAQDGLFGL